MQRVFVLDSQKNSLMPCTPARARILLTKKQASVFKYVPFTIILHNRVSGVIQPIQAKFDQGSKVTGMALVAEFKTDDPEIPLCPEGRGILAQKSDEIEFSFNEIEKNIINLILNHYEEYKDKISMISKL